MAPASSNSPEARTARVTSRPVQPLTPATHTRIVMSRPLPRASDKKRFLLDCSSLGFDNRSHLRMILGPHATERLSALSSPTRRIPMIRALSARRLAAGGVVAVLAILLAVSYAEAARKKEDARRAAANKEAP